MEAAGPAALLGFVLGLQHATDPDHLVAVATIATRERRFGAGALVGALWGAGHMATLTCAGVAILALDVRVPVAAVKGVELAVAAMLVALGVARLRVALRELPTPLRAATDHDHGGVEEVVHRHPQPHVHPSRSLLVALGDRPTRMALRAAAVGGVHGLAGSAALSLVVLAAVRHAAEAAVYLLVFSVGTLAGMTALTALLAYPVSVTARFHRARRALGVTAGLCAIAVGLVHALRSV